MKFVAVKKFEYLICGDSKILALLRAKFLQVLGRTLRGKGKTQNW
jgi:hypothetical protein